MNGFFELQPHDVLANLEAFEYAPTGRILQLNSYENRVFDVELEDKSSLIVKYYRPGRWTRAAIQDEHDFLIELANEGHRVASPCKLNAVTIHEFREIFWSIFPKVRGRLVQEILDPHLGRIGELLAHLHNVGARRPAAHRLTFSCSELGYPALDFISDWIAPEVNGRYKIAAKKILFDLDQILPGLPRLRIHGDFHRGNFLEIENEFSVVDFDDFCNGPAVQDVWMLTSDPSAEEEDRKLSLLLDGYEKFRDWPTADRDVLALLRGLRLIHYSGWIARRWNDPSFPRLFPEFNTFNYWSEETETLESISR